MRAGGGGDDDAVRDVGGEVRARNLDLELDHPNAAAARDDHLVEAGMVLARAVGSDEADGDPEPILHGVVPRLDLVERLLEILGLDLRQEADPPEVDAERRHARSADRPRRAQEGPVATEDADEVGARELRGDRVERVARRVPGLDVVGRTPCTAAFEEGRGAVAVRVEGEPDPLHSASWSTGWRLAAIRSTARRRSASSAARSLGSRTAA